MARTYTTYLDVLRSPTATEEQKEAALAALFGLESLRLTEWLKNLLRDREQAEDVVSLAFFQFWEKLPTFTRMERREHFWALVRQIAKRRAIEELRKRRMASLSEQAAANLEARPTAEEIGIERFFAFLLALQDNDAEVLAEILRLRCDEGLTWEQIRAELAIPERRFRRLLDRLGELAIAFSRDEEAAHA